MKVLLVLALVVAPMLSLTKKPKWTALRAADLPSRVSAIRWDKFTLDADHSLTWGAWTVAFVSEPPVAHLTQCDDDACPTINVYDFQCRNSVVGRKDCSMMLSWTTSGGLCKIIIPGDKPANMTMIDVQCPDDLQLVR